MEVRLQKFLSQAGVVSRRDAEKLILKGEIKVNNCVVKKLGTKVKIDKDIIKYKNKEIKIKNKKIYIILNKPEGYITTVKDQFNRKIVLDLLKDKDKNVYPVGRLDYDTSGLLLLTNDGSLTYKLTHPKHKIYKTYLVTINGKIKEDKIKILQEGVLIDNFKTSKAKVKIIKVTFNKTILEISIYEGKNRQIRKMFNAIGKDVIKLKRISIYKLFLGNLKVGNYRYLTKKEIEDLKNL